MSILTVVTGKYKMSNIYLAAFNTGWNDSYKIVECLYTLKISIQVKLINQMLLAFVGSQRLIKS